MTKEEKDSGEKSGEFIQYFVAEGYDLVDDAESKLHSLDSAYDDEVVNTIFRMFHSIKGTAAYLDFHNIKKVTHEAETLLDIFRKDKKQPTPEELDLLYQTVDLLRQLLVSVDNKLTDGGFEDQAELIVNDISKCIKNLKPDIEQAVEAAPAAAPSEKADDLDNMDNLVTPEMRERYLAESYEVMDKAEEALLVLEKNPQNRELINEIFRYIHSFKGNSGFFGFTRLEEEGSDIETFLDTMRKGDCIINNNLTTFLLNKIDYLRRELKEIEAGAAAEGKAADPAEGKTGEDGGGYKPLGQILVEMGAVSEETIEKAVEKQKRRLGEILVEEENVSESAVETALGIQDKILTQSGQAVGGVQRKEIRVATEKLDKLFDLVGELITAEAMVTQHPDIRVMNNENLNKSMGYLNKITRELQEISMNTRMIPLDATFTKMIRLVRDLSRKSGKKVNLNITGQDTEMDRNIIEEITDPIVHIIRNAVDHGLENPEARRSKGKDETGNIFIDARYEGNEIWITVADDGKGLDREKILKKAAEKGLITGDGSGLDDREVWKIIFEPGFSTAEKITEVSGRGVGMDVVRRNVEKIRGKVDVKSSTGEGTEIAMKIPLTMAILDGITIRVGSGVFSIPSIDILEFFKAEEKNINHLEGDTATVRLRNDIMPLIKLHSLFNINGAKTDVMDGVLMVLQNNGRKACLLIDEIVGNQQIVIKSLSEYIGDRKGLAGCSVMGNGDIALILDTGGIIDACLQ